MPYRRRGRSAAGVGMAALLAMGVVGWGQNPERAAATQSTDRWELENGAIKASVRIGGGRIGKITIQDRGQGREIALERPFAVLMKDGRTFGIGNLKIAAPPSLRDLPSHPEASRMAQRLHGEELDVTLESEDHLRVTWSLILLDDSNYIRQVVTITAAEADVPIERVQLVDLAFADAHVAGTVDGSPIVAGRFFLGFEHPLSKARVTEGRATAWIDRELPLRAGQSVSYSAVMGVAREGQMRRDFLSYVEMERAHPYRTFLHYNSWYDLGYFNPYDQQGAVDRLNFFGRELVEKREVHMDSSLFDDGWDDHASLWKFNSGFPEGFTPVKAAAEKDGAEPGVWMSPWGGYSKSKQERIAFGKSAGYEIVAGGYALSGPRYYAAFRDVCLEMIRKYGVNQFKFDGTGNVNTVVPGSQFDSDFAAAIHLIGELREAKPDLFVNLTTGTWPSPFWLLYADSIWRGGEDDSTAGVGAYRERWITYRDAATYRHVVQDGPLYPLNSLMLHGMIYAQHHKELDKDPQNDFRNEIRSYFGTGTQLQEMYITPSLLRAENWDDLAEAAKWSRANAGVLKDTHWVGGNPAWQEIYGWASWSPEKGILVLRNPSDKAQSIKLRLQDVFELPEGAAQRYSAKRPWKADAGQPALMMEAKEPHEFRMAPFEVITLEMAPR